MLLAWLCFTTQYWIPVHPRSSGKDAFGSLAWAYSGKRPTDPYMVLGEVQRQRWAEVDQWGVPVSPRLQSTLACLLVGVDIFFSMSGDEEHGSRAVGLWFPHPFHHPSEPLTLVCGELKRSLSSQLPPCSQFGSAERGLHHVLAPSHSCSSLRVDIRNLQGDVCVWGGAVVAFFSSCWTLASASKYSSLSWTS